MSNSWRQAYSDLTGFISEHSKVEIGASIVSIPENNRPEFYRLFNTTRKAFVEEKFPDLLGEARLLSENYIKAEQEVTKLLGLEGISASPSLHRFLHNPFDELIRELFDSLFDLLRGKIDIETFEKKGSRNVEAPFRKLYQSGYKKWIALSLVRLLEADKIFDVALRQPASKEIIIGAHRSSEQVSLPNEQKYLSFEHKSSPIFIVPEFIVHSAKINRYVSVRSEMGKAMWSTPSASDKREWYSLDALREKYGSFVLNLDFIVIYIDDSPENLVLIADAKRICRPDLIIECREQMGWYKKGTLASTEN